MPPLDAPDPPPAPLSVRPRSPQPLASGAHAQEGSSEIVWARYGDLDTLDPHRATSTLSLQVWSLIYDTLLATDASGAPVPNLARSWEMSEDGTEYTFTLAEGVTCHDGTPLDAQDVKHTVDRAFDEADPSVTQASWGPITGAEVVDPLTVRLTLEEPFVALIPFLADSFSSIICDSNEGAEGLRHFDRHRLRTLEAPVLDQGRSARALGQRGLCQSRQAG